MPIEQIEMTEERKRNLYIEYANYVNDFNSHLPENMKIVLDREAFMAKLEDPEEVARYQRSLWREQKLKDQENIYARLESKFGTPPEGRHYLNRNIAFSFKTDGSDESNEYNERLYREYVQNPEKLLYEKISNIINFNPQPLYDALGDKAKLVDFYDANQALCEDAFVFDSMIKDDALDWINPNLKSAIACMKMPIQTLNEAKKEAYAAVGSSYLTMPNLTPEQAAILMGSGPQYTGKTARIDIRNTIMNALGKSETVEQAKDFYGKLFNHGLNVNKNFFLSHVAEERQPDGTYKEVSFQNVLNHPNDPNLIIRPRTKDEIWHIRNISKEYEREYLSVWQKKFEDFSGDRPFNFARIKEANKGNFFERTFRRTSREYKEFIKAFEEYNDPNSKNYLNRQNLREKADAYSEHKLGQGVPLERMDRTSRGRMSLVTNVIATLDYMDKTDEMVRSNIEAKLYPGMQPKVVGVPFLQEQDVNNDRSNEIKDVQNVLDVIGPNRNHDDNEPNIDAPDEDELNI